MATQQTLSTTFTPTDTVKYTTASESVSTNVLTPLQKIHSMINFVQDLITSGELNNS